MIVARHVEKSFGTLSVLKGLDLHIEKGRIHGLAGRSGAGKSTFLRCINGLEPYDGGSLIVDGVDVKTLPTKALRAFRKQIGMVFQSFSLLERLTVYDNVALPLRCWRYKTAAIDKKVKELLGLVGIADKMGQKPRALSGGQKQRVAIARALCLEPRILLCDEATSALDPNTAREIIALLRRINDRMGITIVMVTHQMSVISDACDDVAILENGRVDSKGSVEHIFRKQPKALRNLLGGRRLQSPENQGTVTIALEKDGGIAAGLAKDLSMELTLLGGQSESGTGEPVSLLLRFSDTRLPAVEQYLNDRKISWRIVAGVDPALRRAG